MLLVKVQKLILKTNRRLYLVGTCTNSFFLVSDYELQLDSCYEMQIRMINYQFNYGYLINIGKRIDGDIEVDPTNISLVENERIKIWS